MQHSLGEVCIPLNPQRVVVLGAGFDTLLSLGIKPVGSTESGRKDYSYLKNKAKDIEDVGNANSPNLEAIAALKPDLILGFDYRDRKNYELLSQIAPTVLHEWRGTGEDDWKSLMNQMAEALGKTDRAEQILTDYNARIEKFQSQMGDRLKQTEVSIVRVQQGRILLYLEDSACGSVVADAGFPRPDHQTKFKEPDVSISKELLYKADADVIFLWTLGVDEEAAQKSQTALKELRADPLWSNLNAVRQDKVYEVPSRWISIGPTAANLVLDDLFKYFVDSPSQAAQ
ncbi:MAG: iron-siderophore ABC transporter substrate-binding protein [Leptolyngbya sp. SIO4C5]|nr:iron-siderophore ABC transporter substrate-binding protein [Leptolyngbya sp. SIO4C5]